MYDPPICSIRSLHRLIDLVAAAQLIFPKSCCVASLLSSRPAHVTNTFWLCNDFANLVQKSFFAPSHSHNSISSISSVNELYSHSSRVRASWANMIFLPTSSCCMHWSACCSRACVSTLEGKGYSWPASEPGKVYREFVVDQGTYRAFSNAVLNRQWNAYVVHLVCTPHLLIYYINK